MELSARQGSRHDMSDKRSYHHGDLRAQLIEAVRGLVEVHGPDNFSVAEAARIAGVSSAAPYKHFSDRNDILRAVVLGGLERMGAQMATARAAHPKGSLASISAIGRAYIDFARREPGVFRIMFGLTAGHKNDPEVMAQGESKFATVNGAVADYLGCSPDAPQAHSRAYMLWCFAHGHSLLTIDEKSDPSEMPISEEEFLNQVGLGILGPKPG